MKRKFLALVLSTSMAVTPLTSLSVGAEDAGVNAEVISVTEETIDTSAESEAAVTVTEESPADAFVEEASIVEEETASADDIIQTVEEPVAALGAPKSASVTWGDWIHDDTVNKWKLTKYVPQNSIAPQSEAVPQEAAADITTEEVVTDVIPEEAATDEIPEEAITDVTAEETADVILSADDLFVTDGADIIVEEAPAEETAVAEETAASEDLILASEEPVASLGEAVPAEESADIILAESDAVAEISAAQEETTDAAPELTDIPAEETIAVEEIIPAEETADVTVEEEIPAQVSEETAETEETIVTEDEAIAEEAFAVREDIITPETDPVSEQSYSNEDYFYNLNDGFVTVTTTLEDGSTNSGKYLFDADGYLIAGRYVLDSDVKDSATGEVLASAGTYYFQTTADAGTDSPITTGSNFGKMIKDTYRWDGTRFRYYNGSGKETAIADGPKTINGVQYFLYNNGVPRTGDYTYPANGKTYYLNPNSTIPGAFVKSQWVKITSGNKSRYRHYNGNGQWDTQGIRVYNGTLLIDANGYTYTAVSQKKAVNGKTYMCDASSKIYKKRLVTYNGARWYVNDYGQVVGWKNGWYRCPGAGNRYYYFSSTPGKITEKKGWQMISSGSTWGWYYFSSNGNHLINTWNSSKTMYFKPDGSLANGLTKIGNYYYFFTKSTKTSRKGALIKSKIFKVGNYYYCASSTGILYQDRWLKANGKYYYFRSNLTMLRNGFKKNPYQNNTNGYCDSTGVWSTGWVTISDSKNLVKYVNPTGTGFYKSQVAEIDGLYYYFNAYGYRVNDLSSRFSSFFIDCDRNNCVMTVYNKQNGTKGKIPVKSIRISPGKAETPTPTGLFQLTRAGRWQLLMGPSYGQYASHVVGGIYIHSIPGDAPSVTAISYPAYDILGQPASHGCIRVCVADALWLYNNCNSTQIRIFDGTYTTKEAFKGPLGRPALVPRRGAGNFDPTDPACSNM